MITTCTINYLKNKPGLKAMSEMEWAGTCHEQIYEWLNLYVDGELPTMLQSSLFGHLAVCASCRERLEGIFQFRRALRQENVAMPPAVDDAFLKRLTRHRSIMARVDRRADRQPLWMSNHRVSIRSVILSAAAVFLITFAFGLRAEHGESTALFVSQGEELVELTGPQRPLQLPVYVFFPGLTIEADTGAE